MSELINRNVLDLRPYSPGKPVEEVRKEFGLKKVIKLASNENPLPLPKHVIEAIEREIGSAGRYPDTDSFYLRKKIAEYLGISTGNVIVGAGSVEIIKMIVRVFLRPGERVLTARSTFPMYRIAAIEQGGREAIVETGMDKGWGYDLDQLYDALDGKVKIIFIANPNNPTGTMVPSKRLLEFIGAVPEDKVVVLDNAYQEYVADADGHLDGIDLAVKGKNVIVLRTFSKIYGLAGLRVGYAIAKEEIIGFLNRARTPFNVSRVAQEAALASLERDDFKNGSAELNRRNMGPLFEGLRDLGTRPVPSFANFILFFPGKDVEQVYDGLLREGVIVRPLGNFGLPEGMRVTVGLEEENNFFLEKLEKVLQGRV